MVAQYPVSFRNHQGLLLRGVVHEPKYYDTAVVYLHGFPGDMSGSAADFCSAFSGAGYLAFRFDFSGSGTSQGAFRKKRMSDEVRDTKAAIDFLSKQYRFRRLILVGISTGAIDAALYAHTDKRVSGLVLAAVVHRLDEAVHYDFSDRQAHDFWRKGYITYDRPGHWVHRKRLDKAFYDEYFKLDVPGAIKKYKRPLLIIHGENDEAIPLKEPRALYTIAHKPKRLVIIPGAGHTFRPLRRRKEAIQHMLRFMKSVR